MTFKSPKRRIFARICAGSSATLAGPRRHQHRRRHQRRHRGQAMHYSCFKSLALCEDLLFNGPNAHESRFRLHHGLRMYDVQIPNQKIITKIKIYIDLKCLKILGFFCIENGSLMQNQGMGRHRVNICAECATENIAKLLHIFWGQLE